MFGKPIGGKVLKTYSFAQTLVMVNGQEMKNWADGDDVISTEYREDGFSDEIGAGGEMMVTQSADESAEITLKFLHTAPENDYMERLYKQHRQGVISGIDIAIFNTITGRSEVSTTGYIPKIAKIARGKKGGEREWTIVVSRVSIQQGV